LRKKLVAFFFALAIQPVFSLAQSSLVIPQGGVMRDIPGAHELPDPNIDYKIVFDIRTVADSSDSVSPGLKEVATLINTFRKNGVTAEHMHLVAVFHGKTILLVTNDATYRARTGEKANPNMEILKQLDRAGVKLVICGQSALAQNYDASSLLPYVQTNLSATVTFINLQARGYIKVEK